VGRSDCFTRSTLKITSQPATFYAALISVSITAFREIARSVHEAERDVARRIAATPAYQHSRHERKKVEKLFAHLKRILKNWIACDYLA